MSSEMGKVLALRAPTEHTVVLDMAAETALLERQIAELENVYVQSQALVLDCEDLLARLNARRTRRGRR